MIWFIRAVRWVRNPPSEGRVKLVLAIVAAVVLIASIQWMGWWPDWATMDRPRRRMPLR